MSQQLKKSHKLAKSTLELKLQCQLPEPTRIVHQYTTHPLRVSHPFRLEPNNDQRIYLYIRNNSPGLFAEDELNLSFQLDKDSQLYLTEQAATKVHPALEQAKAAKVNYQIALQENASLEFVTEPLILYADAALEQKTNIQLHPSANIFWSEIILPGRLARGESYQFRYYDNQISIISDDGKLLLKDRSYLEGKDNKFIDSSLFASHAIIGTAIAVYPQLNCQILQQAIDNLTVSSDAQGFVVATSVLPYDQGVIIRVMSDKTEQIKNYFSSVLNEIRAMKNDSVLPYIPK